MMHARVWTSAEPEGPFDHDAPSLAGSDVWNLVTDHGRLDITFEPSGTAGYEDLSRDAIHLTILGVEVDVASLADVIRSKEVAGRHKDRLVLPVLRRLLEEQGGRTGCMAEVLLFHHAQGLTPGCLAFAERLRAAGHVVHAPDLYDGRTFDRLDEGIGHARQLGFDTVVERGRATAEDLSNGLVYAGFSLGVMTAQELAQTRPGAKGALLLSGSLPTSEFGGSWPKGVPVQVHMMENDPFVLEGDLDAARELVSTSEHAELFLYPGDRHLFADDSLPDHDEEAAALLEQRVLRFLDGIA